MLNEAQGTGSSRRRSSPSIRGVAIALTVLGLNLLGDGLRDAFDPRLVRRGAQEP